MKKYLLGLLLFFVSCGIGKTYLYELDFTEDKDRKSGNIFNVFVHDKKVTLSMEQHGQAMENSIHRSKQWHSCLLKDVL